MKEVTFLVSFKDHATGQIIQKGQTVLMDAGLALRYVERRVAIYTKRGGRPPIPSRRPLPGALTTSSSVSLGQKGRRTDPSLQQILEAGTNAQLRVAIAELGGSVPSGLRKSELREMLREMMEK
jgi:hypothetical protein